MVAFLQGVFVGRYFWSWVDCRGGRLVLGSGWLDLLGLEWFDFDRITG